MLTTINLSAMINNDFTLQSSNNDLSKLPVRVLRLQLLRLEISSLFYASSQNATALAAATFSESTPCDIGIFTV